MPGRRDSTDSSSVANLGLRLQLGTLQPRRRLQPKIAAAYALALIVFGNGVQVPDIRTADRVR